MESVPRGKSKYPPEFRREAMAQLRDGRAVRAVADDFGVSEQTLRNWRRQDGHTSRPMADRSRGEQRDDIRASTPYPAPATTSALQRLWSAWPSALAGFLILGVFGYASAASK